MTTTSNTEKVSQTTSEKAPQTTSEKVSPTNTDKALHNEVNEVTVAKDNTFIGGNVTFKDITQIGHQTILQQKPDFVELNLERFNSPNFPIPNRIITHKFIEIIKKTRLLVLGGGADIDKADLARYLAWEIKKLSNDKYAVSEWQRSSNPQSIDVEIQKEEKPTVFILNQVSPQNVGYNLSRIQKAAAVRKHLVLLTTDIPLDSWKLSEDSQHFWQNITSEGLYTSDVLVNVLFQELHKISDSCKEKLLVDKPQPETIIAGDLTFIAVAEQLQTPDKIARFVRVLEKELETNESLVIQQIIAKLINEVQDNKIALNQWYNYILNEREQLLALGLNFFDGMFNDQFFAALEEVVEQVWQKRNPYLQALDYCDLDNLHNFFNIHTGSNESKIESCFPKQRRMLFQVAWKSHSRQIIAALQVITKLVQNSVASRSFKEELYGSYVRREQLRIVLSEAISDIGWIYPPAVQDTLRQLAADGEIEVQAVAAYAMARWRDPEYGRDQELFATLKTWHKDQFFISQIQAFLNSGSDKQSEELPESYIKATIALTISYASLYDQPNQLNSELCELLENLSKDLNSLVQDRLCTHTLPTLVPQHLIQLREMLRQMTQHTYLIEGIASSLALAYQYHPQEVLNTLNSWQNAQVSTTDKIEDIPQENVVATVALTYGEIRCDEKLHPLTTNQAFEILQTILKSEKKPGLVREAVIIAMGSQVRRNFEQLESKLLEVTTEITLKERNEIVRILNKIYLDQREKLEDGDREIKIKNRYFQVWLDPTKRPHTAVEKMLFNWLKDDSKPLAQEIATHASVSFAVTLEQEEAEKIKEIKRTLRLKKEDDTTDKVPDVSIIRERKHQGPYLDILVPWITTIQEMSYRLSIRNLLPEGLKHYKLAEDAMKFVLQKWKETEDNQIRQTSDFLRSSFRWYKILGWLLLGSGGVLTMVGIAAVDMTSNLNQPVVQPPVTPPPIDEDPPEPPVNGIPVFPGINVSDIDSPNFDQGTLTIKFAANPTPSDRFMIRNQGKNPGEIGVSKTGDEKNLLYGGTIIGSFAGGDGVNPLVVKFNAQSSPNAAQALLRNIYYENISSDSNIGTRTVQVRVNDGQENGDSNILSQSLIVSVENQQPSITVPNIQPIKENTSILIKGIKISDSDSSKLTVNFSVNNGIINIKPNADKKLTAIINNNDTNSVTLSGTVTQINTTLTDPNAITYKANKDFTGNDSLNITVNDGGKFITGQVAKSLVWPTNSLGAKTASDSIQITVNPLNIPPEITVPSKKTAKENTNIVINDIRISDPDSQTLTVTLSVKNGKLTIKPNVPQGLTDKKIIKNGTKLVTITGTIAEINSTLSDSTAITYSRDKGFNGNDSIAITASDGKNKGKSSKTIPLIFIPSNRPPVLTISESVTINNGITVTKEEARNVINKYLVAKARIFAPPYDRQLAKSLTTGKIYEDIIKSEGSLNWLQRNNAYYQFGKQIVTPLAYFSATGNQVEIDVKVTEEYSYYEYGILRLSRTNIKDYRFTLRLEDGVWKIADRTSLSN